MQTGIHPAIKFCCLMFCCSPRPRYSGYPQFGPRASAQPQHLPAEVSSSTDPALLLPTAGGKAPALLPCPAPGPALAPEKNIATRAVAESWLGPEDTAKRELGASLRERNVWTWLMVFL